MIAASNIPGRYSDPGYQWLLLPGANLTLDGGLSTGAEGRGRGRSRDTQVAGSPLMSPALPLPSALTLAPLPLEKTNLIILRSDCSLPSAPPCHPQAQRQLSQMTFQKIPAQSLEWVSNSGCPELARGATAKLWWLPSDSGSETLRGISSCLTLLFSPSHPPHPPA